MKKRRHFSNPPVPENMSKTLQSNRSIPQRDRSQAKADNGRQAEPTTGAAWRRKRYDQRYRLQGDEDGKFAGKDCRMAMTKCKECRADISTKAEACPQCGAKRPKQTSGCAMVAAILIGLVFFMMMVRGCSDDSSPSTSSTTSSTASSAPAAPVKAPPPDPAKVLAEAEGTVSGIELKIQRNSDWLKKYYATTDQVNEATADLVKLALVQGMYAKSTVKQEKSLSKHAESLSTRLSRQQRVLYASSAEEIFVKNGMDVKVSALGKNNDQLRLKYVLMSKPLVYKFQNEMKLDEQARVFDFKEIIYTDGYDSTWHIDL